MIALRVARAVLRWNLTEAADIIGTSPGNLSNLEADRLRPSAAMLERIRAAYGEALETAERHYGKVETRELGRPGKVNA